MPEMKVDTEAAAEQLRQVLAQNQSFQAAHQASVPAYSPAFAGRGFVGHGQRIAELLAQVHERAGQRAADIEATARAAQQELGNYASTDATFATNLTPHLTEGGAR